MIQKQPDALLGERRMIRGAYAYFRSVAPKPADSASLPEVISLTWRFEGEHPDDALRASMDDMENLLGPLCFSDWSRLVLVMTFRGVREWCFYANDYPRFTAELNAALANRPPFPIQIEHNYDPKWSYWQTFVDRRA
jgi:hypothetical protein